MSTADPRNNTNIKKISSLTRTRIDDFMEKLVADTNDKIYLKFRELGVTYVPFKLVYHSKNTRYAAKKWHNVKNVTLEIDKKFTDAYFSKKIGFYSWLSNNYPDIKREVVQGHAPDLKRYIREFNKDVKWQDQKPFSKDDWNTNKKQAQGVVAGYIKEKAGSGGYHGWETFTGKQLNEYLENEDYIFKGEGLKGERKSVMSEYMERQSGEENKRIKETLNEVLKEFNETFQKLELTHIFEDKNMKNLEKQLDKPQGKRKELRALVNQQKLNERPEEWKTHQKFPNIKNIRDWFIKTGIYKSYKFDEFNNMKSTKQKKNFIDQSVFLIANGVFTKRQGKQSYKLTRDPETPNYSFRKYRETAGKKIRADTMRRRSQVTVRANRRKDKYDNWNKEVERMARGWKNRDRRRKTR